jgi:DNA-binding CsgD family transcriptional regulator
MVLVSAAAESPSGRAPDEDWRTLLAIGLLVDDVSAEGIARRAGVGLAAAIAARESARVAGVLGADDAVEDRTAAALIADLPPPRAAQVHAVEARRLLSGTPADLRAGLEHLRAAAVALDPTEVAALAERAGVFALDLGDHEAARDLLTLALDHGGTEPGPEARRQFALARALVALGDGAGSRDRLLRTVLTAEEAGDVPLAVLAACRFALPAEWQTGDPRATGLLERVLRLGLEHDDRTRVMATRAWVEARMPVARVGTQQLSWVSRPTVAQPLAEQALADSATCKPGTRLIALLAWRHTHRGPAHLDRRRAASSEALDLAQSGRALAEQVEAAVLLAVDALEAGDRPEHRRALALASAAAEALGGPRMRWRALVPAAATALMEGHPGRATELAAQASEHGRAGGVPGLLASEWLMAGQFAITARDPAATRRALDAADHDVMATSSIGRSGLALLLARAGRRREAREHAVATLGLLEEEGSLLLSLTRLADVVWELGDVELAHEVRSRLAPWSGRVAVDANGWWCDGPVDLWLGMLELLVGDADAATAHAAAARRLARAIADARALGRLDELDGRLAPERRSEAAARLGLTAREAAVLTLLTTGATYHEIADELRFSASTIRNEASSIYRKLDVSGRSEAAARAVAEGLVPSAGA